jgi:hypothetical protein
MRNGAAWRNRPEGDVIMRVKSLPTRNFTDGSLTDCAAYGKPRSDLRG